MFALCIGAFLLVEGIWGFFSPVVFGVLTTNTTHAVIHVILGAIGVWVGRGGGNARVYCTFLGVLLLVVGIAYFLPITGLLVQKIFNVNTAVAIVNLAVGGAALTARGMERSALRAEARTI